MSLSRRRATNHMGYPLESFEERRSHLARGRASTRNGTRPFRSLKAGIWESIPGTGAAVESISRDLRDRQCFSRHSGHRAAPFPAPCPLTAAWRLTSKRLPPERVSAIRACTRGVARTPSRDNDPCSSRNPRLCLRDGHGAGIRSLDSIGLHGAERPPESIFLGNRNGRPSNMLYWHRARLTILCPRAGA